MLSWCSVQLKAAAPRKGPKSSETEIAVRPRPALQKMAVSTCLCRHCLRHPHFAASPSTTQASHQSHSLSFVVFSLPVTLVNHVNTIPQIQQKLYGKKMESRRNSSGTSSQDWIRCSSVVKSMIYTRNFHRKNSIYVNVQRHL